MIWGYDSGRSRLLLLKQLNTTTKKTNPYAPRITSRASKNPPMGLQTHNTRGCQKQARAQLSTSEAQQRTACPATVSTSKAQLLSTSQAQLPTAWAQLSTSYAQQATAQPQRATSQPLPSKPKHHFQPRPSLQLPRLRYHHPRTVQAINSPGAATDDPGKAFNIPGKAFNMPGMVPRSPLLYACFWNGGMPQMTNDRG